MTDTKRNTGISALASTFTFGVELETIINNDTAMANGLRIGDYHNGIQVPYLPEGWTAERDGSLQCRYPNVPCEIVSPILKGPEGIKELIKVIKTLKQKGHKVNISCGVHYVERVVMFRY